VSQPRSFDNDPWNRIEAQRMTREQSPTEAIREHQRLVDARNNGDNERIPDDVPLTELAEDVVRGKRVLSQSQMRMLIELLPYYPPKLAAIADLRTRNERDFAVKMDKALERIARTNGGRTLLPPQFDEGPVIEGEIVKEG